MALKTETEAVPTLPQKTVDWTARVLHKRQLGAAVLDRLVLVCAVIKIHVTGFCDLVDLWVYHTFVSYFRVFQMSTISRVWPTALKLGCITNLDMLFLMMGFISLIDEIQFMLINCIKSIGGLCKLV